jgi:TonB family protein
MIAYYSFTQARLSVSALFSIAVHALILLCMTGFALFPQFHSSNLPIALEVILASNPSERVNEESLLKADKHQAGDRSALRPSQARSHPKQSRALQSKGNAQWSVRPGIQDDTAWKSMADQPTRHRTVSAASHEARDAAYLARWRDRVEQFGTQYYQQKIRQMPMAGEVRILVSIGPKGQLLDAQIRQSSGKPALDKMALDILRQSAPFEPLPAEIRSDTDILEIIRTWRFTTKEGLRAG